MTEKEIHRILEKGEGITVEFKRAESDLPKNLFETVCAFLNRNGGTILLGADDDGTLSGVNGEQAENLAKQFADLSNNPNKLDPVFLLHPSVVDYKGRKLLHVFVPASSMVHKTNGKVFDRSSEGDFEVKSDALISEIYFRKRATFSESIIYPYLNSTHFADGIVEKSKALIRAKNPSHPWLILSDEEFFQAAGVYRTDIKSGEKGFTMAALMLFGRDEIIQSALPHYKIDALLRRDDLDRYDDREYITSNLITAYEKLMAFVTKHLPDKFYLEGDARLSLRDWIFREIISNLLIHREYTNAHPATFIIYRDQVVIKNANKPHFHRILEPGNFEPFPKNPNLAKFFVQMNRAEDLGTGIRNVFKYLKHYTGTIPVFKEEDLFVVEVPLGEKAIDKEVDGLAENETIILQAIATDPRISARQLASKIKTAERTVHRYLKSLQIKGKIKRVGSRKGGHWELVGKMS